MKSMLDYTFETGRDEYQGQKRDVWLFLGAAWIDDLPYHAEFLELAADHDNFHYVPCLSREPWLSSWDGETDYIQDALLKYVDERALSEAAFGRHMAELLADQPDVETAARVLIRLNSKCMPVESMQWSSALRRPSVDSAFQTDTCTVKDMEGLRFLYISAIVCAFLL